MKINLTDVTKTFLLPTMFGVLCQARIGKSVAVIATKIKQDFKGRTFSAIRTKRSG